MLSQAMLDAPPAAVPLIGVAGFWLWNLAEDGESAAHCVDACVTLSYALAEYGIEARPEAVCLTVEGPGSRTLYGGRQGPYYNPDGTFNGHVLLVIPGAGRFLDPTVQQYFTESVSGGLPLMAGLPAPSGMGDSPLSVPKGERVVTYHPVSADRRKAWKNPVVTAHDARYRQAGANLAANVFDMLRSEHCRDSTASSPYPRLRRLLAELEHAEAIADGHGYRFVHPRTRAEVRLADIP